MYNILKLNKISNVIDQVFNNKYSLLDKCDIPDAILVRSYKMNSDNVPSTLLAVARAGAGVNNIPCEEYKERAIVVFNTPGANANAVKELVVGTLINASRNIISAINWVNTLKGYGEEVKSLVEKGKSAFAGSELFGKTIGIIGLGAIGMKVAEACISLGMKVIGYDPYFLGKPAYDSHQLEITESLNYLYSNSSYITIHTPYLPSTKGMINKEAFALMQDGTILVNCSRGELVDFEALKLALSSNKLSCYANDFVNDDLLNLDKVINMPHLGASTEEAEDNCAVMAGRELIDYLENGNITNSVNFPNLSLVRDGQFRISITALGNDNINNVTNLLSQHQIITRNMAKAVRNNIEYILIDTDTELSFDIISKLNDLANILRVRLL